MGFRNRFRTTGSLVSSGNRKGTNSTSVDDDGNVLYAVCKRKHFIEDVEACTYCGKWVCRMHRRKAPQSKGMCVIFAANVVQSNCPNRSAVGKLDQN